MEIRTGNVLEIIIVCFRLILGALFLYAGIEKAIDPAGFAQAIGNYWILPGSLVNAAAIFLPWVEIIAGMSLLAGMFLPGGALIISGLLLVFSVALGFNLLRGLNISCGCFSTSAGSDPITWWYLLRDITLFGMGCMILLFAHKDRYTLNNLVNMIFSKAV